MKFLVDNMLGTLAKWLRLYGLDASYPNNLNDNQLAEMAMAEDRILLTRDVELSQRRGLESILIKSDDLEEQIEQLKGIIKTDAEPLSRCSVCNGELVAVEGAAVRDAVPEGVFFRQKTFWRCVGCERTYWPGSHFIYMVERMNMEDQYSA